MVRGVSPLCFMVVNGLPGEVPDASMLQGPLSQLLQIRTSYCQPSQTTFKKMLAFAAGELAFLSVSSPGSCLGLCWRLGRCSQGHPNSLKAGQGGTPYFW